LKLEIASPNYRLSYRKLTHMKMNGIRLETVAKIKSLMVVSYITLVVGSYIIRKYEGSGDARDDHFLHFIKILQVYVLQSCNTFLTFECNFDETKTEKYFLLTKVNSIQN
jgi:hypothetical protein